MRKGKGAGKDDFMQGVCVALGVVRLMDCGVTWAEIVKTAGVADFLRYVTEVEPAEWELSGCDVYAESELRHSYGSELDAANKENTNG